jgi:dihydrofolate reductase
MSTVFLDMAVSLDGFISGPDGQDHGLHNWYFNPSEPSRKVIAELIESIGAMVVGRRAYNTGGEHESADDPYQMPHFIITHHIPERALKAGSKIQFVTDGVERALEQARAVAGKKDICIAGGANIAQQFLQAGLIDEIRIHLVPVLLGGGLRLFDHLNGQRIDLQPTRVIEATGVTHLRFRVLKHG